MRPLEFVTMHYMHSLIETIVKHLSTVKDLSLDTLESIPPYPPKLKLRKI